MSPQFLVSDLGRSLEFYTKELGFEIDFLYEDFYAGIAKNGHSIHLKLGEADAGESLDKRKNEHLDIMFSVDDIQVLFDAIKNRPVVITQPLREMPYGFEFYITDPDGYILSFIEEK